jgi:hypothetical protein
MQVTLSTAINMDNYNLAVEEVKTILENIEGVTVTHIDVTDELPLQNEEDWFEDSRFEILAIIEIEASKWNDVKKTLDETPECENISDVSRQWNITYDYGQCETHITAENEQDALDWLIDELEKNGAELYVKPINEVEDLNEDMYVIGGNHGLALIHNGLLHIEEY